MSVLRDWTSSFTPAFTRSSRPTRLPFLPFPFSSGIGSSCLTSQSLHSRGRLSPPRNLRSQERSVVVELSRLSLWPLIKPRNIHQDLTVGRDFHFSSIHRARRRTFEVNPFAVVSTAVARAFELVLTGLPIGSTTQMGAARVDHENAIGGAIHP